MLLLPMELSTLLLVDPGNSFQQEIKMRNLLIAACCAALVGSVSIASAETSTATAQGAMKAHNPMDSSAKMMKKKHKMHKMHKTMKSKMKSEGRKKDDKAS
jgi:hypothetical protein